MENINTITGEITNLAFGGEGILRHENLVIFVPFTAVGDRVICRITKQKKNFAYAELVELVNPSLERVNPRCPYFGTCGGCQLQHLNYNSQLNYKRQAVEDGLKRIGNLTLDNLPSSVPAETQWAYRRHITLTLKTNEEGTFSAGYIATDNRSLIQINQCPIFTVPEDPIIQQINEFANRLSCPSNCEGRVMILKHNINDTYLISFHFQQKPHNVIELTQEFMQSYPSWAGVLLKAPRFFQAFGLTTSHFFIEDLSISFSPDAFIQNHPEQSLKVYQAVCQIAREGEKGTVLDLYCGIGITSLMMAKAGRSVVGVESNNEAVKLAQSNAKINQVEKAVFIKADVKEILADLLKRYTPNLVVINPPREGMEKSIVKTLVESGVKEIVYISCMPATLARDLKELCQDHYQVKFCQSYDMFPQTAHVETLVHLVNLA
jgi:23S rRNA (uracil1939-C5)-methyltransferase